MNPHSLFLFPIAQHSIGHKGQSRHTFDRHIWHIWQWPTDFQVDFLMMLLPNVVYRTKGNGAQREYFPELLLGWNQMTEPAIGKGLLVLSGAEGGWTPWCSCCC